MCKKYVCEKYVVKVWSFYGVSSAVPRRLSLTSSGIHSISVYSPPFCSIAYIEIYSKAVNYEPTRLYRRMLELFIDTCMGVGWNG